MASPAFSGLLIRLPATPGAPLAASGDWRRLSANGVSFELTPLFSVPAAAAPGTTLAGAPGWEWHLARPTNRIDGAHAWELAHATLRGGAGLAAGAGAYVEPDLLQSWPCQSPGSDEGLGLAAAKGEAVCTFHDQIASLPRVDGHFAWHLEDEFSQLAKARASASRDTTVRIAHLDTGFDPNHATFPLHVLLNLQKNFIDDQPVNDARDPAATGLLNNPGHGTATLALLAGKDVAVAQGGYRFQGLLGGAPESEIIPIRVGKSVVQILTSSVAGGIHYAADLCSNPETRVHVLSMSMGGVASRAWADAVNLAYEAGIVLVTAAGNNFSSGFFGFPTHFIVYPARFRRVIAACGVMANRAPYYDLPFDKMQGNWGPSSKMATAISSYTPNTSWAKLGCGALVNMDGEGTSAATPQIAAAAALYLRKHGATLFDSEQYPEPWMRVEAVRRAMFTAADKSADAGSVEKLGNGIVQALDMLAQQPAAASSLQKTEADRATFPFLRVLTGIGLAASEEEDRMIALEATQLAQQWLRRDAPNPLDDSVADPDLPAGAVPEAQVKGFLEGIVDHPLASKTLKDRAARVHGSMFPATPRAGPAPRAARFEKKEPAPRPKPFVAPEPNFRTLRGFSVDPSLTMRLDTAPISEIEFKVPWEKLEPGPAGEYLAVIDVDPASGCVYEPVQLDEPKVLAQGGLAPSEGTPQFHQQMVYAAASLTIHNFERALGRRTLWRPGPSPDPNQSKNDSHYVPQLRIYPHALRERNAYYSPQKIALLFGYFQGDTDSTGETSPGMVFTCLSHDIVAHETTHALVDGMHSRLLNPTNPDVLAFHEAFADMVALFQHFTFPEILRHEIAGTRGEIRSHDSLLGKMAVQFGMATGLRGALRSAIGEVDEATGEWRPHKTDPTELDQTLEPHARGSILVAAVFDAFLQIYDHRTADLYRLATGGTGILRPGAIHPDLVARLSEEAAKCAQHTLTMCIRALDYCPPVDITFGEFLRAIITADRDLVPDDDLRYRVSFIEAFRRRGIYPRGLRTLSEESLTWRSPQNDEMHPSAKLEGALERLRSYAHEYLYSRGGSEMIHSRERLFHLERKMRRDIHGWMKEHFGSGRDGRDDARFLGVDPDLAFEVHTARFAMRMAPDGGVDPQIILSLLQEAIVPVDSERPDGPTVPFEGGSTMIADLLDCNFRYCIRKNLSSDARRKRQQEFAEFQMEFPRATYFGRAREPFAALHRGL